MTPNKNCKLSLLNRSSRYRTITKPKTIWREKNIFQKPVEKKIENRWGDICYAHLPGDISTSIFRKLGQIMRTTQENPQSRVIPNRILQEREVRGRKYGEIRGLAVGAGKDTGNGGRRGHCASGLSCSFRRRFPLFPSPFPRPHLQQHTPSKTGETALTFDDSADEVFSEVVEIVHVVDDDVAVGVRHCAPSSRPRADYAEKYLHQGTE